MSRRRHPGFTITELLVVVATIALLLGVLLPALAGLRASGRSARCLANLRQMAIAAQRYALEYGFFPPALRYERDGGVTTQFAWDWVTTLGGPLVSPGALWDFADDPGTVQQCPGYHGETNSADPYTGYNYNTTYVGVEPASFKSSGWEDFRQPAPRYSECRRLGQVALFGDGGHGETTNKYMRAPMGSDWYLDLVYAGSQAFRHLHSSNVAYLDLHVASAPEPFRGARATPALLDQMGYPQNGFLSDDDRAYDPR